MGGRSSDSDTDRSKKSKKTSRSKRSRSRSSSASESSGSSDKRKYSNTSKYEPRNRASTKFKSSRRHASRNRDRKDFSRSSHSFRQDRRYYQRSRSRSRERCKSKDSDSTRKLTSNPTSNPTSSLSLKPSCAAKSTEDQLKLKMQLALKAAADADALLRQQGLLTAKAKEWGRNVEQDNTKPPTTENKWPKEPLLSVKEQIDRAKALEEINAPEFQSQAFVSGIPPSALSKETDRVLGTHDSAMFGGVTDPNLISVPKSVAPLGSKNMCVAHENLFANIDVKEEKWIKKLMLMRQRKLNGEVMC